MQQGNYSQGKLSPLGWRNLIKRFKERTGWKHDKEQLKNMYRQLKTFYSAMTVLQSSTGGSRAGGGYKVRPYIWEHFIHKLKEVERLKYEEPSWAWPLPDMFSDVAIDFGSMLGTAAARDSEDTPAPQNTSQPTSGSCKRGSSGELKSSADSPTKKEQPPFKLRSNDEKATKALTHLSEKQHQTHQEQHEQYRQCLELAVECGIDAASEEYFFLSEEKFKDEQSRDSFLIMKTREARRSWIARAFERRHRN
ncbi:hypothetical protein PVAP13_8KG333000 [Panicum virgatum]|uniref:Myb/SANT-like domain-containing protein n=1 Tax=Panicum virgatum TaxID=38727 RepID=A0A8T0PJT7_PANVG|nr:hypothetical protein PVAP13_8KG333000 [Panicum virgatum]